jgi:hypothetical protein
VRDRDSGVSLLSSLGLSLCHSLFYETIGKPPRSLRLLPGSLKYAGAGAAIPQVAG